jgi:hypothetical protein
MQHKLHTQDSHLSLFSRDSLGFMCFFKELCPGAPQNSVRGAKCIGVFPSHKNVIHLTMRTNILTFPRWKNTSAGAGQPQTGRSRRGRCEDWWLQSVDWDREGRGKDAWRKISKWTESYFIIIIIAHFFRYRTIFSYLIVLILINYSAFNP